MLGKWVLSNLGTVLGRIGLLIAICFFFSFPFLMTQHQPFILNLGVLGNLMFWQKLNELKWRLKIYKIMWVLNLAKNWWESSQFWEMTNRFIIMGIFLFWLSNLILMIKKWGLRGLWWLWRFNFAGNTEESKVF